jgi:hypothetical protein
VPRTAVHHVSPQPGAVELLAGGDHGAGDLRAPRAPAAGAPAAHGAAFAAPVEAHKQGREVLPELIITPAANTEDDLLWTDQTVVAKLEQLDASTSSALAKLQELDQRAIVSAAGARAPSDPAALAEDRRLDELATKLRLLDTPGPAKPPGGGRGVAQGGEPGADHHLHELELQLAELETNSAACWADYKASHRLIGLAADKYTVPATTSGGLFSRSSSSEVMKRDILGNKLTPLLMC